MLVRREAKSPGVRGPSTGGVPSTTIVPTTKSAFIMLSGFTGAFGVVPNVPRNTMNNK